MECSKKTPVSSNQTVESVINTDSCMPRRNQGRRRATSPILLTAVNARYSHTSYSVRSLKANLGELEDICDIFEADLSITPCQLAARIVETRPVIAGFSIYLWDVRIIEATVRILRKVAPQIKLVAGGPELTGNYPNAALFDLCIIGEGETAFREYCRNILYQRNICNLTEDSSIHINRKSVTMWPTGQPHSDCLPFEPSSNVCFLANSLKVKQLTNNIIEAEPENPDTLKLPYHLYTEEDIANRVIYVEASRGCPYSCSYCTSAGTGLRLIPLERLLAGLDQLWNRGARRFKFLDRSFTASQNHAHAVMSFFRERLTPDTRLHFEINTDRLSSRSIELLSAFPAGTLHLECGIQTLNAEVAERIGRSPDVDTTLTNLTRLVEQSGADVHADMIFGLPGDDEASFAAGFNALYNQCRPPPVQINLLKSLPGTELAKHADRYKLSFNQEPPYELLKSDCMDFNTLMRIQRMSRCWELVHNRGQFPGETEKLLSLSNDVYATFGKLTESIYKEEGRMHRIGQPRLKALIEEFCEEQK